jgi:hypothetical protein
MVMPVIRTPQNAPPLFGGKAIILVGAVDKEGMRRWQQRNRAAKGQKKRPPAQIHDD